MCGALNWQSFTSCALRNDCANSVHTLHILESKLTPSELVQIQTRLGLSDTRMAAALGVTRQTWRNWRMGRPCPQFVQNSLGWLMELRRLSPANENIPERMRFLGALLTFAGAARTALEFM